MSEELTIKIRKDLTIRLEKTTRKHSQRRSAVRLIISVPVYDDESEEFVIANFGEDGNFSISEYAVEQAGLTLNVQE